LKLASHVEVPLDCRAYGCLFSLCVEPNARGYQATAHTDTDTDARPDTDARSAARTDTDVRSDDPCTDKRNSCCDAL